MKVSRQAFFATAAVAVTTQVVVGLVLDGPKSLWYVVPFAVVVVCLGALVIRRLTN
jgi:hypothetical protein